MPVDDTLRPRFEAAVDQLSDSMFRVAFRLTGNRESARELVQECYFQAWKNLGSLKDPTRMRSWLFSILRNQFKKQLRGAKFSRTLADADEAVLASGDSVDSHDTRDMVQKGINRLQEQHKLPLLLVSMEGLSVDEAADILQIPRGTVLSRLHRARERLKTILHSELEPK